MGKNRNFQTRIEAADARREKAKLRKQQSETRRNFKLMVTRDLFSLLDRHGRLPLRLSVWTDTIASDTGPPCWLDGAGNAGGGKGGGGGSGRGRSVSLGSDRERSFGGADDAEANQQQQQNQKQQGGGRQRAWSGSISSSAKGKKKAHPRSRQAELAAQQAAEIGGDRDGGASAAASAFGGFSSPLLCRSHFFRSTCAESKKSSSGGGGGGSGNGRRCGGNGNGNGRCGCRYLHYSPSYVTLGTALNVKRCTDAVSMEIKLTQAAYAESQGVAEDLARTVPGAMEMMYYLPVELNGGNSGKGGSEAEEEAATPEQRSDSSSGGDDDDDDNTGEQTPPLQSRQHQSVSDELYYALASRKIKMSSVAYVVLGGTLIFDRYRDGLLVNDREFLFAQAAGAEGGANGGGGGDRRLSVESEGDISVEEAVNMLPGPILEHMLKFLPDAAVSAVSQVCRSWHHEIGQNSPDLWRHLLQRRGWPIPTAAPVAAGLPPVAATATAAAGSSSSTSSVGSRQDGSVTEEIDPRLFRGAFVQHYTAMRDVNAIKAGLSGLTTNRVAEEREMCYQDFSTRKNAPSANNLCVATQIWSPKRILTAYSRDCSLRLFEAVSRGGGNGEKLCREIVSVRVDPYKNTKRRSCSLVSMGLDEESIGCLCHVMADNVEAEAYILVVISRDDFLFGGSATVSGSSTVGDDVNLNVIDIGEAVLNFILSSDVVDHRTLQLIDFLQDGGEVGEIEVLVSQTIAACGYSRYMLEVSISIPVLDANEDDVTMQLLDRKLVLFSANAGAIVWMGESNDLKRPLRPRREDMTLTYLRQVQPGGSRAACSVAVASVSSPVILSGSIDPSGHVHETRPVEACDAVRDEIGEDGWEFRSLRHQRPVIVTESDIIAVDIQVRLHEDVVVERRSFVSFYPRYPALNEPSHFTLTVEGDIEVVKMASLREKHAILICRHYRKVPTSNPLITGEEISVFAIVLYVPDRMEIGRVSLMEGVEAEQSDIPEISVVNGEIIGVGLSSRGVVMTGNAVRAVGAGTDVAIANDLSSPKSAKKKKKKMAGKGGKKDNFARGMTLRG